MRRLLAVVVAAAGVLGAVVAAFAVGLLAPADSESAHQATRLIVFALVGGLNGVVTAVWLCPGVSARERLTSALVLAAAFAIGAGAGDQLQPLGGSLRQQGALGTYPIFIAAIVGALIVAELAAPSRSTDRRGATARDAVASPAPRSRPASPPLTPHERAAVERAVAVLDRLQRFHARVADGHGTAPDEAETERFFDDGEECRGHWETLPASHAATASLSVAAEALTTAVEMRFVAHGWHERLEVEPGDAEGVALARQKWGLTATDPSDIADALLMRARTARMEIDALRTSPPRPTA